MPFNLSCPGRSSSGTGPSCRCGPLLSGGPSGSSLPSECFWAYMAHPTISFSSLPWVREAQALLFTKHNMTLIAQEPSSPLQQVSAVPWY